MRMWLSNAHASVIIGKGGVNIKGVDGRIGRRTGEEGKMFMKANEVMH